MPRLPAPILFLDQSSDFGGGQRVLLDVLHSLRREEFQPLVALSGQGEFRKTLAAEGVRVFHLPIGNYASREKSRLDQVRFIFRTLLCSLLIVSDVFRHRVRLIYANGPRVFLCAAVAGELAGRPVLWHLHNVLPSGAELRLVAFFSRWVRHLVACSKAAASPLLDRDAGLAARIRIIHNPVRHWSGTTSREAALRDLKMLPLPASVVVFGIIGRITPFKGQRQFVEAGAIVLQQSHPACFCVIGSPATGDRGDRSYLEEIQIWVRTARLESSVFFVPYQCEVEQCYALLDVVVLASQGPEGLGLTALEAMSLGKAIIAPATGGIPEMLEDQKTALLASEASPAALADRMFELIRDPDKRRRLGENARRIAQERFSAERFEQEILQVLREGVS
ncbi:MAG: glycosyltransferase family 4 protein [Acidobacteria bacterium]|nr:glycosyltransferase family 4 protein [Acidobacteriota bacterium]